MPATRNAPDITRRIAHSPRRVAYSGLGGGLAVYRFARAFFAVLLALAACGARAEPTAELSIATRPSLALPIACSLGRDCWVANYFDVDAATAVARDFRCHTRSYEGHDGTDFALRDEGLMRAGVAVLAAAAGTVRNVRDGMPDAIAADAAAVHALAGRECGNGVVIDHPGGWQTQYCHLRQGSVRVKPGEAVATGAQLAEVGLSGRTEFPHLHLAVRLGTLQIDPFSGLPSQEGCGAVAAPLWRPEAGIDYEDVALYNAGFSVGPPDIAAIRRGERASASLAPDVPSLVLWVDALGVQAGDVLMFSIRDPAGRVLHRREQSVDRTQARRYGFSGMERPAGGWLAGAYIGEVVHIRRRGGQELMSRIVAEQRIAVP